jgi:hypothetical protein
VVNSFSPFLSNLINLTTANVCGANYLLYIFIWRPYAEVMTEDTSASIP